MEDRCGTEVVNLRPDDTCPCGSGLSFRDCCGRYLEARARPLTAGALMRSRYTAYVLHDTDYLLKTWHPHSRPALLDLANDDTVWEGLTLLQTRAGRETDDKGEVEFVARYRQHGAAQRLHETSRFVRVGNDWLYLDGQFTVSKPGRNDPCACGSGKKFKKCCGSPPQ